MKSTINAFILAAGMGERLRPITDSIPKPLLPLTGRPLVERILDRVSSITSGGIGMNMHHRWEKIRDWAISSNYSDRVTLFFEKEVLGTGGGIKNAEPFLREAAFLVHNSDIISDIDLSSLIEIHESSNNILTLAIHDWFEHNNVWINRQGAVEAIGEKPLSRCMGLRPMAFTGIAVYSPRIFGYLPVGRSGLVGCWMRAIAGGERVGTADFCGCRWADVGTPTAYAKAVFESLKEEGEVLYVHPSLRLPEIKIGANTIIERGAEVGAGAELRNCILLEGAKVPDPSPKENVIIGPGFELPIPEPLKIPASLSSSLISQFVKGGGEELKMTLAGKGGSDRQYFRVTSSERSAVLLECPGRDPEFHRHIIYTDFFRRWSVPVPELYCTDSASGAKNPAIAKSSCQYALFEDLGDLSLYSWMKCNKTASEKEEMYRRVIEILINLHTTASSNVSECPLLKSRIFDYQYLLWESAYFLSKFCIGLRRMEIQRQNELQKEFEDLARMVDSFPKRILHRDFQSQNILIGRGGTPRVIDYQGARMGPPAYDLASILWDPYVELEDDLRSRMLDHYIDGVSQNISILKEEFFQTVLPCRIQRHMQALGAYGFLSKVKGKKYFEKYIPAALRYLKEETGLLQESYPVLYSLAADLYEDTGH